MNVSSATSANSAAIWSGASPPQMPEQKFAGLFSQIDDSNSGSISKAQFEQAFRSLNPAPSFKAAGSSAIWAKLDPNQSGSVSKQEFVQAMTAAMKDMRGFRSASAAGAAALGQGARALDSGGSSASDTLGATLDLLA